MTNRSGSTVFLLLLLLALAVDLFTPFLIWKGVLPSTVRWLSDLAVAGMLALAFALMLVLDHIPRAALLILGLSLIGITVAVFEGQGLAATGWGWWLFFRYPLIGLFAYLQPRWPERFPRRLITLCLAILALEVIVQLGQYASGETPGDNLAGLFGRNGTAALIIFILFVLCLALGRWLADGNWRWLLGVLLLGGISSAFGEMKLFPFAIAALGLAALFLYAMKGRKFSRLLLYLILFGAVTLVFASFYNRVVADERGTRRLEEYLELQTLDRYLNFSSNRGGGRYELGRGLALRLGWENIQRDATTFLFGMGLGARGESVSLGIAGQGLRQGYYGLTSGTSLLVLMQELGVLGLAILGAFMLWAVLSLAKDISLDRRCDVTALRYALILFSMGWPLWLWYTGVWRMSVTMLLYWATLGYVLARSPRVLVGLGSIHVRKGTPWLSWQSGG